MNDEEDKVPEPLTGDMIATAFNAINVNKSWKARATMKPVNSSTDIVHFEGSGLVSLLYDADSNTWQVKFNKFQAGWGDYVSTISRSFLVILGGLKAAGLPFDAPIKTDGIVIETINGPENTVYVRWQHDEPVYTEFERSLKDIMEGNVLWENRLPLADAIMPEIADRVPEMIETVPAFADISIDDFLKMPIETSFANYSATSVPHPDQVSPMTVGLEEFLGEPITECDYCEEPAVTIINGDNVCLLHSDLGPEEKSTLEA